VEVLEDQMNEFPLAIDGVVVTLLAIVALSTIGLIVTLILYFLKRSGFIKRLRKPTSINPRSYPTDLNDIHDYGINEIRSSGRFTAAERKVEYRRRGKSPSGVIDGVYNDAFRGNDSYNDLDRDWDADA
jgi:hypothetical protein